MVAYFEKVFFSEQSKRIDINLSSLSEQTKVIKGMKRMGEFKDEMFVKNFKRIRKDMSNTKLKDQSFHPDIYKINWLKN